MTAHMEEALLDPAVVNKVLKEMFEANKAHYADVVALREAEQKATESEYRVQQAQIAWRNLPRTIDWPAVTA